MSTQTELSFIVPTLSTDGLPITEPLTFTALIDTSSPPVKAYPVPPTAVITSGVCTVTFVELGFVPVKATDYFVEVTATDADGTSAPSSVIEFAYSVVPQAPTGVKIS